MKASVGTQLALVAILALTACARLLPRGEVETVGAWQSYQQAEEAFGRVLPHRTGLAELKAMNLLPSSNPNITILNYSDLLRRFIPSPAIGTNDLDDGVRECLAAKAACKGFEVNQSSIRRQRYGNFVTDFLHFVRKTHVTGWRFNGVILVKDDLVVYKLVGGQPSIEEREESRNPLGPLQGAGESALRSVIN